ncbi:hypothetical protein [Streptomyces globosus]|uniref:hypothetical protein n=1 Tax=Streptomyces globosus TaxID=68209 RepID=UPI0031E393DA
MESELPDHMEELVDLQWAYDAAHDIVKRLQEELAGVEQWTDEQQVAWRDAWEDWREVGEPLEDMLEHYAETLGLDVDELRAQVEREAGHDPQPVGT